jgi:HEAT repeat protein
MKMCLTAMNLARHAKDPNALVRERAVRSLAEIDHPRAVKALTAALSDVHRDVQLVAAEAFTRRKEPEAIEPLLAALEHRKTETAVQQMILRALANFGDPGVDKIVARLQDPNCTARAELAEVLGRMKERRAVQPLIGLLNDEDVKVRKEAAHALGRIGDPSAVDALLKEIDDDRWLLRSEIAEALGRLGDKKAVDALIKHLKDEKWLVQRSSARALSALGDPRATPALIELLMSTNEDVRTCAAEVLGTLGDPRAVAPLLALLRDPEASAAAVNGLRILLKGAAEKLPAADLTNLSKLPDPVRTDYEVDDEVSSSSVSGGDIVQVGTKKIDVSVLRKMASDALAKKR